MDPSLIRRLRRLHVLRASASASTPASAVPPLGAPSGAATAAGADRRSMEALVRDLSHALDESSSSQSHRRRRGWRRRSRSAGNLCSAAPPRTHSEDSGSSVGEAHLSTERQHSSVQVSDSDEMVSTAGILSHSRRTQRHRLAAASGLAAPPESDSVNENFSPARLQRRKRKLKRMAMDAEMSLPSTSVAAGGVGGSVSELRRKRSKMQHGYGEGRCMGVMLGKRKFGRKEACSMFPPRCPGERDAHMEPGDVEKMHGDMMSSSSLSSGGESEELDDTGGYTNDEGREGDDEQSDWYHEPADERHETERHAAGMPLTKPSREIRAGRRRLRDRRPAFSIVSSLNDRIAAFLQDPQQTEVRLQTLGGKAEEDQLGHLASIYSLRVRRDAPGAFSAFKTGMTTRGVRVDQGAVWAGGDSKRRRRAIPNAEQPALTGAAEMFSAPAPWLSAVPPTIVEMPADAAAGLPGSRPTSGDGHTPVPPESSSPQTTEEPLSPMNEAE